MSYTEMLTQKIDLRIVLLIFFKSHHTFPSCFKNCIESVVRPENFSGSTTDHENIFLWSQDYKKCVSHQNFSVENNSYCWIKIFMLCFDFLEEIWSQLKILNRLNWLILCRFVLKPDHKAHLKIFSWPHWENCYWWY